MSINNFGELRTAYRKWLIRSDMDTFFPECVQLFEAEANQRLRVRQQEAAATLTPSNGTATLPADYLAWKRVTWTGDPRRELEYVPPSVLTMNWPDGEAGIPQQFTIEGSSLKIRPIDSANIEFLYYQKIPALDPGNDASTNWLLTAHPNVYLAGVLVEAYSITRDDDQAVKWGVRREMAYKQIEALSQKSVGGSMRVVGPTP
jgi:hypothetical protein